MSAENVEAIRQRIVSLVDDTVALKRKVNKLGRAKKEDRRSVSVDIKDLADQINCRTRELYHLLPENLRPDETLRPQKPREPRPGGPDGRKFAGVKPGGPIPRDVRWPDWTVEQILKLADAYEEEHASWPNRNSGRVQPASPDTWNGIDLALQRGNRNLPGGISLARLLADRRGAPTRSGRPDYEIEEILRWADDHHARTGSWPNLNTGTVTAAPAETWMNVDRALRRGFRGLPGESSLARLLAARRDVPNLQDMPPLSGAQILSWADAYYLRSGAWPTRQSGSIPETNGENWKGICNALRQGNRSLAGGSSLARFLAEHRGKRNRKALPDFDIEKIVEWADRHHERQGRWPTCWSGAVEDAPGETWSAVDSAFKSNRRGLANSGYRSLSHLLDERRGKLKRHGWRPADRVLD